MSLLVGHGKQEGVNHRSHVVSHRGVLGGLLTLLLMQSVCKNRLSRQKACAPLPKGQSPMADHELTPEEGVRLFNEIFGSEDASAPPKRGCCKYFLDYQDGESVFRLAEVPSKPTLPRDEFDVIFGEVMVELFGPDPEGDEMCRRNWPNNFPDARCHVF